MIETILTILSNMVIFAIALLPAIMAVFYKRLNLGLIYDYQSVLRMIPISVILLIISSNKIIYISLIDKMPQSSLTINLSLFFAIAFVVCTFLSIYFIIDRAIMHFKNKPRKLVLNISAGITIFMAILTIFQLVSQAQEYHFSYIDFSINLMFPTLTGVLSVAGIISFLFYKKTSKMQRVYSFIFIFSIPLIVLDLIFSEKKLFSLTSVAYTVYIIVVFLDVFSSVTKKQSLPNTHSDLPIDKYDLTEREKEVYNLAVQGMTNKEISKTLFVSIHTVKTHLQHIFSKLNINNRYQLINFEKDNKE